jgi:hypothetical protein
LADQRRGTAAELCDGAGRRVHALGPERLHRIDDDEGGRRGAAEGGDDIGNVGLGAEGNGSLGKPKTRSAHAHLGRRLLAGEIDDGEADLGKSGRRLQEQRRLADAGIAADQNGRARYQAAAEHPVELGNPGGKPRRLVTRRRKRLQDSQPRLAALDGDKRGRAGRRLFLDHRIPLATSGAFAGPAGAYRAAGLADEGAGCFGHGRLSRQYSAGRRADRGW